MGLILNGNAPSKMLYNGAEVSLYFNGSKIWPDGSPTPPTPPGPSIDEVTIGTQTWMSKNLAIDDGQGGIYTQTITYGQDTVVEYYYTWEAAVRVAASIAGWHLPSSAEFEVLQTYAGGSNVAGQKLKATYGWGKYDSHDPGSDTYGFTWRGAGYYYIDYGRLMDKNYRGYLWTITETTVYGDPGVINYFVGANSQNLNNDGIALSDYHRAFSVRLIKDS